MCDLCHCERKTKCCDVQNWKLPKKTKKNHNTVYTTKQTTTTNNFLTINQTLIKVIEKINSRNPL